MENGERGDEQVARAWLPAGRAEQGIQVKFVRKYRVTKFQ